jgi:hypothetical protein
VNDSILPFRVLFGSAIQFDKFDLGSGLTPIA